MKFLKIIASSFSPRSVREKTGLTGRPLGFYAHSQNFQSEDDIINLLKYHIAACERIPPTTKDHYEIDILTEDEESIYVSHFTAILRARQSQHYQYSIGMLDQEEWEAMLASFRTLLRTKKNIEIWDWISPTFPKNFVALVEEQKKLFILKPASEIFLTA